jgi:hypothetical protein
MQAAHPLTELPSPMRTAASHELLRVVPVHVNANACPCAMPLLVFVTDASTV